jgi:hypothetical protein
VSDRGTVKRCMRTPVYHTGDQIRRASYVNLFFFPFYVLLIYFYRPAADTANKCHAFFFKCFCVCLTVLFYFYYFILCWHSRFWPGCFVATCAVGFVRSNCSSVTFVTLTRNLKNSEPSHRAACS